MGNAFLYSNCGGNDYADLNFCVRAYASESDLPDIAQENTIGIITDVPVTSWSLAHYSARVSSINKNLLYFTHLNNQHSMFTNNGDGTITVSYQGEPLDSTKYYGLYRHDYINEFTFGYEWYLSLHPGTYTLSGCPQGGSDTSYGIEIYTVSNDHAFEFLGRDVGDGFIFNIEHETIIGCYLYVALGVTDINQTFKPQLERGDRVTEFVAGNAVGQVKIAYKPSGKFPLNVLKSNIMNVYPYKITQYTEDGWVNKHCKIYQNGKWLDFTAMNY
jgi:hypothetical protein